MNKLSILINTCDAYSDAWSPFFRILEKTWPSAVDYNIYLNTETKDYQDPYFNIKVLNCIDDPQNTPWGKRLLDSLDRIDSEYVLFLLEDFFFEDKVLDSEILRCIAYLDENRNIASICLTSPMECADPNYCALAYNPHYENFIIRKQRAYYKYDASPSVWRKCKLVKCTFKKDSPWDWEFFGNMRTWFTKDIYLGRIASAPAIFKYDIIHGGAIHRGKWVGYKMRELQEKYNIEIDMSHRGIVEDWMKDETCTKPKPRRLRIRSIIRNRVKGIFSVIYSFLIGRYK